MTPKAKIWLWLIASFVLIGLALFIAAGTINYWQAWVYLGVGAASSVPLTLHILNDPIQLENRTKAGPAAEQRPIQKIIVACSGIPGIAAFIVPGLDHRHILTILGLVWRLFDEEKFLAQNLPGYMDYCAKVRWHLIPGVF